jgi:hypothetical protein
MLVTFPTEDTHNANPKDKMELVYRSHTIVLDRSVLPHASPPPMREVIDCRCYMGRSSSASVVYASIWVHGNNRWWSGSGSAGGYGYHKTSAAIAAAIRSAGITLGEDIGGAGDYAVKEAFERMVRALGYQEFIIVGG